MKYGKHQKSKERWQDLCWKVHDSTQPRSQGLFPGLAPRPQAREKALGTRLDSTQSFVLLSYSMHELRNQHVSVGKFFSTEWTAIVFCAPSRPRREQKHTTKNFVEFIGIPLLVLTVVAFSRLRACFYARNVPYSVGYSVFSLDSCKFARIVIQSCSCIRALHHKHRVCAGSAIAAIFV